jgi:hypothetical protein
LGTPRHLCDWHGTAFRDHVFVFAEKAQQDARLVTTSSHEARRSEFRIMTVAMHLLVAVLVCDCASAFAFAIRTRTGNSSTSHQLQSSNYNNDGNNNVRVGVVQENFRINDGILMDEYQPAPIVPFAQQQQPRTPANDYYYSRAEEQQQPQQSARERRVSFRPQQQKQWWETTSSSTATSEGLQEIQGDGRTMFNTPYQHNSGRQQVYLTTEGRPLDASVELYEGPNNTPTRLRVYSEDGRLRPFRTTVASAPGAHHYRGNGVSVRNDGPLAFPVMASVQNTRQQQHHHQQQRSAITTRNNNHNSIVDNNSMMGGSGYYARQQQQQYQQQQQRSTAPKTERKTVQGGSLKTFTIPESVPAVQVVIVTDGMPMYANVELWGCGGHVKQVAEIYNDDGYSRPFSAIVETPGGQNTICVKNTGPMAYPVRVSIEPYYDL